MLVQAMHYDTSGGQGHPTWVILGSIYRLSVRTFVYGYAGYLDDRGGEDSQPELARPFSAGWHEPDRRPNWDQSLVLTSLPVCCAGRARWLAEQIEIALSRSLLSCRRISYAAIRQRRLIFPSWTESSTCWVKAAARLNNRSQNSYQPTRKRERRPPRGLTVAPFVALFLGKLTSFEGRSS
jgi:hypothetical protein